MFDLGLEWTMGVGDGGRARRFLPEEAVYKQNNPWLYARHCISGNEQISNQNELNKKPEALPSDTNKHT